MTKIAATATRFESLPTFGDGNGNGLVKRRIICALFLGVCLVLQAPQVAALENRLLVDQRDTLASPKYRVNFRDDRLSIEAKQAPWKKVLHAISKKTGIRFHYSIPLQGSITLSFTALSVKQALERLFGPEADFIFRYSERTPSTLAPPQDVWVIGTVRPGGSQGFQAKGGGDLAAPRHEASPPALGRARPIEAPNGTQAPTAAEDVQASLDLNDGQVIDALAERARDEHPVIRLQALSTLSGSSKTEEGAVELALEAALTDEDPSVRGYAVQALANRRGLEAMGYLWQALQDPDPDVRIMAVDSAVPKEEGLALLREALSDADETVRSLTASRLRESTQADAE